MLKKLNYATAASMLIVLIFIAVTGLRMPWSEEGVIYALYGGTVGFYLAIAISMLTVWKMQKKKNEK